MKHILKKLPLALIPLYLAMLSIAAPVTVSAHYINPNTNYDLMAAVGADGHDHEHAPVAPVANDGHTDHTHAPGASSILVPGSSAWWGVMFVSLVLMSLLSYGVWKYLQVAPVQSAKDKLEAAAKKEEKPTV